MTFLMTRLMPENTWWRRLRDICRRTEERIAPYQSTDTFLETIRCTYWSTRQIVLLLGTGGKWKGGRQPQTRKQTNKTRSTVSKCIPQNRDTCFLVASVRKGNDARPKLKRLQWRKNMRDWSEGVNDDWKGCATEVEVSAMTKWWETKVESLTMSKRVAT